MPIFHAKALRNRPKLAESQSLIEMSCMNVRRDHSVELQNAKAYPLGLFKGILNQKLTDVQSAAFGTDGVACIADMPAAPYIVRMKDIKPIDLLLISYGHRSITLSTIKPPPEAGRTE